MQDVEKSVWIGRKPCAYLVTLGILGTNGTAFGLATEEVGPDRDHPTVEQADWPKGIVLLPRHPSRVYSLWLNGMEDFYFKASLTQVNELLALFSKSRLRDHEVWIERGSREVQSFGKAVIPYNVHLRLPGGLALAYALAQEERGEATKGSAPQLRVYVDETVPADRLVLPDNLLAHGEGIPVKGKAEKPSRRRWYGRIQFGDGDASPEVQTGVEIRISLWEPGYAEEVKLARVGHQGWFSASFSDAEMADLKAGRHWLTITVGNWLTEARKSDPVFPVDKLGGRNTVEAVRVPAPEFYYGRVLFEDGTPPKLDPEPWPGARISISFPYAGAVEPDAEGCFKVFFTDEQYAQLKSDKARKNIYIPDLAEKGRSTARVAFPVDVLSRDKTRPGTIKIPRP